MTGAEIAALITALGTSIAAILMARAAIINAVTSISPAGSNA